MIFIGISLFKGNWMLVIGGGVAYYLYFKLVIQGLLGMWSNPEKGSEEIAEPSEMPQGDAVSQYNFVEAAENEREKAFQSKPKFLRTYEDKMSAQAADAESGPATKLYARAKNGDAEAQYYVGHMYWNGEGVRHKNESIAVNWYRKAAEQGQAAAQFELGFAYYIGEGVIEDETLAAKWFRKSVEQGHPNAQFSRGSAYHIGRGVIEDKVQAYAWYNIAAANGDEGGKKLKTVVAREMTKEQIAKAQDLSREMVEANPKLIN